MQARHIQAARFSRPYAIAAFSFALEHKAFIVWQSALELLAVMVESREGKQLCTHPGLSHTQRADAVYAVFEVMVKKQKDGLPGWGEVHAQGIRRWVHVLAARKKLPLSPLIAKQFVALVQAHEGIQPVTLASAFPLGVEPLRKVAQGIEIALKKKVVLQQVVVPRLIGGIVIRMGDQVIDGSIRNRMNTLVQRFQHAV